MYASQFQWSSHQQHTSALADNEYTNERVEHISLRQEKLLNLIRETDMANKGCHCNAVHVVKM